MSFLTVLRDLSILQREMLPWSYSEALQLCQVTPSDLHQLSQQHLGVPSCLQLPPKVSCHPAHPANLQGVSYGFSGLVETGAVPVWSPLLTLLPFCSFSSSFFPRISYTLMHANSKHNEYNKHTICSEVQDKRERQICEIKRKWLKMEKENYC